MLVTALLAAAAGAGCSGGSSDSAIAPGPPDLVAAVTATVAAGACIGAPVSVRVYDINGKSLANDSVTWTPHTGQGTMQAATTITDVSGVAANFWTIPVVGTDTLVASATGAYTSATVTATVTLTAGSMVKSSGDAQTVAVNATSAALVVLVKDGCGNPLTGQKVTFAAGGGVTGVTLSASSATTAATGLASITVKPTTAGAKTITATLGGLPVLTFTMTAQ